MSRAYFLALPAWRTLREHIEEQVQIQLQQALEASDKDASMTLARREYSRGWYDALRSVLELPNLLLKDGENEEKESNAQENGQEVAGARIVPERKKVAPLHHISKIY